MNLLQGQQKQPFKRGRSIQKFEQLLSGQVMAALSRGHGKIVGDLGCFYRTVAKSPEGRGSATLWQPRSWRPRALPLWILDGNYEKTGVEISILFGRLTMLQ